MPYTPENNPYIPGDPYSYDLKWVVDQIKYAISLYEPLSQQFSDLSGEFDALESYIRDYFDNLDVSQEISEKLDEMAADGSLSALIQPLFDAYKAEINGDIAAQNAAIATLTARMDTFASLPAGSTAGDAELLDIRVGANGVTYPSAGAAVRGQIDDINTIINTSLNYKSVTITEATTTDLYLKAGQKLQVNVTAIDGRIQCYTAGHTSAPVLAMAAADNGMTKYFVAGYDGYIRFYPLTATLFTADLQIVSDVSNTAYTNKTDISELKTTIEKTRDLTVTLGSLNTASGAETASTAALRTEIIPKNALKISCINSNIRIYAYEKNGTFVGGRTATGTWTTDYTQYTWFPSPVNIFELPTQYNYRIVFGQISGDITADNIQPKITVDIKEDAADIYTVGAGKQYSTLTAALIALKDNDARKIIYIYPGTYDIFTEMGGADFIAAVDTSLNWRAVNNIVPPNTEIIGIGDVVLTWQPTDTQIIDQAHAFLFSPLNLSGNCAVRNITVICSNCRYGIHDETSGQAIYNGVEHEFENVTVIYHQSTYGVKYAYGAGHNRNSKYRFKNCLFSSYYTTPWSTHDWPASAIEKSVFEFDNCIFLNSISDSPGNVRFSSSDTAGRLDDVKINGCVLNGITFTTEGSTTIKQGYKVTTMLCKQIAVAYTSHLPDADRIPPVEYLTIS